MSSYRFENLPAALIVALLTSTGSLPAWAQGGGQAAVILLDRMPEDPRAAEVQIDLVRSRLEVAWRVEDATSLAGFAWPDPSCEEGSRATRAARVREDLRSGTVRFFDETDVEGAREMLQAAMDRFLEAPCALAGDARGRTEAVTGAVLLLRLHLLAGRPEAAADLGRRLLRTFGSDELAAVDVPPEVTGFLERLRVDAAAAAVDLEVVMRDGAPGTTLLMDGRILSVSPVTVRVARGVHVLTMLSDRGARTLRVRVEGPDRVVLEPGLSFAVRPGPGGSLVAEPAGPAHGDLPRRLAVATGRTVIRVVGVGGRDPVEASVAAEPSGKVTSQTVLRLEGAGVAGNGPIMALASGPLVRRKAQPWPWVTGAVTAGLLAAAITLNVQANHAADAVNSGTNRLDAWRSYRAGSIACYALAAAAGAGTVVLAVLGRPGPQRVVVSPVPGGAAVGFQGSF